MKTIIRKDFKKKDGTSAIYLQVIINRRTKPIPLDISWPAEFFDEKSGMVLPRTRKDEDSDDYNMIITNAKSKANDIFKRYRIMEQSLSMEQFLKEYNNYSSRKNFVAFMEETIKERYKRNKISHRTYLNHMNSLGKLKGFKNPLPYMEINSDLINDFSAWIKSKYGSKKNTIWTHVRDVFTYLGIAKKKGIIMDEDYKEYHNSSQKGTRISLKVDEVKDLIKLYRSGKLTETEQLVLKRWLFSCQFGGFRVSDLKRFEKTMVEDNELVFYPKKGLDQRREPVRIPLTKDAMQFLPGDDGKFFEYVSDAESNRSLKDIAKRVGINKVLTNHVARHTFATMYLEAGGSVYVLQKILGHAKIETTMIYVTVHQEAKEKEMEALGKYLNLTKKKGSQV